MPKNPHHVITFRDTPSHNDLTPVEKFERALWEAETALTDAKDEITNLLPGRAQTSAELSSLATTCAMMLAMLQIAASTIAAVRVLHNGSRS